LQERINERDVDRVVNSVLNDVLDNELEEKVMTIEPNIAGCGVEASGKQVQVADSGNCALQRIAAMAEHDEEEDDELLASDWEGVTIV
jgi:hypothetical protein